MTLLAKSAGPDGSAETLLQHTLNVVSMARSLCDRLPLPLEQRDLWKRRLEAAAAFHDIGKGATGFQRWLNGKQKDWGGKRHEVLSAAFASLFAEIDEETVFAVLTHHRQIPSDSGKGSLIWFGPFPDGWDLMISEWGECADEILLVWDQICNCIGRPDLKLESAVTLPGIRLQRIWLKDSPTSGQTKQILYERRRDASTLRGLLITADHLASGHAELPPMVRLSDIKFGFTLRKFQERAGETEGNAILKAPTGSGKTEAAILWATRNQPHNGRFLYTLPFTAAINAMHRRIQRDVGTQAASVGILHGRAAHHLYSTMQQETRDSTPAEAQALARAQAGLAREMYYPIRVCTPHQLLRYTLRGKGWEQMFSEIPGACIVLDEVHSYDPELAGLTLGTARLFGELGAKVLFCSATLPRFMQQEIETLFERSPAVIEPDPNDHSDREILDLKRHIIDVRSGTLLDALPEIISGIRSGKRALIVCNHVRSSQDVFRAIDAEIPDGILFHSRFNMSDRRDIEAKLASNNLPPFLVATQVVEVSLDVSFDCGYFEPAPIDALAQRMGRVNRRGKMTQLARIAIFEQQINPHQLYDSNLTAKTLELLRMIPETIGELDLVRICDEVYRAGYNPEQQRVFMERRDHPFFTEFKERLIAGRHNDWTDELMGMDHKAEVLPTNLKQRYDEAVTEKRWLDADALLINMDARRSGINKAADPWTVKAQYHPKLGLLL